MQHIKGTEKIGVLKEVAHTDVVLTDSIAKVIYKFDLEKYFSSFNMLKNRGYEIGGLLKVSVIMPFVGVANVYALLKHGYTGMVQAKKDAYYTAKNNEHIDWRKVLYMTAKRKSVRFKVPTLPYLWSRCSSNVVISFILIDFYFSIRNTPFLFLVLYRAHLMAFSEFSFETH